MEKSRYICPKCGYKSYKMGEARMAGSFWAKIFDIQNRKFTTVTCEKCSHTGFYQTPANKMGNVFDFFTS